MTRLVIEGCAIATVDGDRTEHPDGHIVVRHGFIDEVGAGPAPASDEEEVRIDGRGMLATPGLVNCHHHLYQWATRGLAQDNTLFEWLQELYPVWAHVDAAIEQAAARAGLVALARSGCTTASDHHYLFPRDAGDLLAVEIEAAREVGLRFHPCRGSMDLGRSAGGLPPDEVVEDRDAILAACEAAIDSFHDTSPDAMVRIALAPCSPFSVTQELMRESAELARAARRAAAHAHGRDRGRGALLPRAVRLPPGRVPGAARLARRRRLARALRAPGRARGAPLRRDRHRRRALPELQRAARRGDRARPRAGRPRRAGRARRRRRRLQRGRRARRRAAPGAARRAAGAAARARSTSARRSSWARSTARAASAARPRSARWSRASSPTSRCGGSTASTTPGSRTRSPRSCSARARSWTRCWSAAASSSPAASCARSTRASRRATCSPSRAGWRAARGSMRA